MSIISISVSSKSKLSSSKLIKPCIGERLRVISEYFTFRFDFICYSYKQRRFNLFREESEGYAKLITELNNESIEHTSVSKVLEIIKSLIGKGRLSIRI